MLFPDYTGTYAWEWTGGTPDRLAAKAVAVRPGRTARVDAALRAAGTLSGELVGATLPPQFITVNAHTGEYVAPEARVAGDLMYTLGGLGTQQVRIFYSSTPAGLVKWPRPVKVTAGRAVSGVDLGPPAA